MIINWAIQTNPSNSESELAFVVADFGTSIASLYGYES